MHFCRLAQAAQILIGVAILCTFGLQFYVPTDILWRKMGPRIAKDKHNLSQIAFRAGTVLMMGGVAAAVPKLDPFIGLVGAVFFSFLGKYFFSVSTFEFPLWNIMSHFNLNSIFF